MRATEFIAEGLSSVVYHYTSLRVGKKIVESGEFQLSSAPGSVEQQYAPKGYPYFLSTSRSRRGGYHTNVLGYSGVLFVLDGRWYNRHYKAGPLDYWQERGTMFPGRSSEAEDRIFSKDPNISIGGVTAVHVYVNDKQDVTAATKAAARQLLILAKKRGIPTYFYNDPVAWVNFDQRNPGDITMLTGQEYVGARTTTHKGYLNPWVELIFAKNESQLDKKANELRRSLMYSYDAGQAAQGLATDLGNARKPDSGIDRKHSVNIIKFMRQNKINDIKELVDYLVTKWDTRQK